MAESIESEESCWLNAAYKVLVQARRPMHYTDIKRICLDMGLMPSVTKTTLEAALSKEAQLTKRHVSLLNGHPGVFYLTPKPGSIDKDHHQSLHKHIGKSKDSKVRVSADEKYAAKYRRMKRLVKDTIFTNAAICDDVVRLEQKIARVKEERRYLLRRVLQRLPAASSIVMNASSNLSRTASQRLPPSTASMASAAALNRPATQSIAQLLGEVEKRKRKTTGSALQKVSHLEDADATASSMSSTTIGFNNDTSSSSLHQQHAQTKGATTRQLLLGRSKRLLTPIPLDSTGRPIFPIELGSLVVYCLGETVPLPGYYTTELIYPVGFCSTRLYLSINKTDPPTSATSSASTCLYTCKVLDGGSAAMFDISSEDRPELAFIGSTPSQCHEQLLRAINSSWGEGTVPTEPKGAEFFGLSHPTIQNLIQSCAGARRCADYRWIKFETGRNRADFYIDEDPSVNVDLVLSSLSTDFGSKGTLTFTHSMSFASPDSPPLLLSVIQKGAPPLPLAASGSIKRKVPTNATEKNRLKLLNRP